MDDSALPVLNVTAWWTLRQQFNRTLPKAVSSTYLGTVLSLKDRPAKDVLRTLKILGLVGDDNEPTDLAIRWRDDDQYPAACEEIVQRVYPDELRAAVPPPDPDPAAAAQWFQRSRRLGAGAAKNAARTYVLIASAELPADGETRASGATKVPPTTTGSPTKATRAPRKPRPAVNESATNNVRGAVIAGGFEMPRPQIAVQINITPEMSAEQIDQVFASMAKHFYSGAGVE